jgi:hypothetical protein
LVELNTIEDVWYLRNLISHPRSSFYWEIDPAKRDISGFETACTLYCKSRINDLCPPETGNSGRDF